MFSSDDKRRKSVSHNIYERYGTLFEENLEDRRCRKIAIIGKKPLTCLVRVFFVFVFAVLVSIGSLQFTLSFAFENDGVYEMA